MSLLCPEVPRTGTLLEVSFRGREDLPKLVVKAVVKRASASRRGSDENRYFVALRFVDVSSGVTRALRRMVLEQILEHIEMLRQFPAFASLSELDLMALAGVCSRVQLAAGAVLVRHGDEASALWVVGGGVLRLGNADAEVGGTVEMAGVGQLVGEVSAMTGLPHDVDIVALEDAELLVLPRDGVRFLAEMHPDTALRLMEICIRVTGMRMRRLTRKLCATVGSR
jgi:hypothetical protein